MQIKHHLSKDFLWCGDSRHRCFFLVPRASWSPPNQAGRSRSCHPAPHPTTAPHSPAARLKWGVSGGGGEGRQMGGVDGFADRCARVLLLPSSHYILARSQRCPMRDWVRGEGQEGEREGSRERRARRIHREGWERIVMDKRWREGCGVFNWSVCFLPLDYICNRRW